MQEMTLCFLVRGEPPEEILLGLKRVGFGAGKITGFGGKVDDGETVAMAAIRELKEEIGVQVLAEDLRHAACLRFVFPAKPTWSQMVYVFLVSRWQGQAVESLEMAPAWFGVEDIPYAGMWEDGAYWLPWIVTGERIRAQFVFGDDNETVDRMEIEMWDGASSGAIADIV